MSQNYSHGVREVDFCAYSNSGSSVHILVMEIIPADATFCVEVRRKRNLASPVLFGGSVVIVESGVTTIGDLLERDDYKFERSEFLHCPDYEADMDYTILSVNVDTAQANNLDEFQYKSSVSLEYGASQLTPFGRELLTGTVSVRLGTTK